MESGREERIARREGQRGRDEEEGGERKREKEGGREGGRVGGREGRWRWCQGRKERVGENRKYAYLMTDPTIWH